MPRLEELTECPDAEEGRRACPLLLHIALREGDIRQSAIPAPNTRVLRHQKTDAVITIKCGSLPDRWERAAFLFPRALGDHSV